MNRKILILVALLASLPDSVYAQQLTAVAVQRSIDRAVKLLYTNQGTDGSWSGAAEGRFAEGVTALATLALLNAGESPQDPRIQKAINKLLAIPDVKQSTYVISLRLMVLAMADPSGKLYRPEIQKDVDWLVGNQSTRGATTGGWSYPMSLGAADSSNSQFALLGLHEAATVGARIPKSVWDRARTYWENTFDPRSGGFAYDVGGSRVNGSMTCAGISSLILANEHLAETDGMVRNGKVVCCGSNTHTNLIERGFEWLASRFSIQGNPESAFGTNRLSAKFYYLYGLERTGRLSGRRFVGNHDWYREGAEHLIRTQSTNGQWVGTGHFGESDPNIATSFAVLFLSKGKRPIAIGKYKVGVGDDWDRHPQGVHYLTRELENQWNSKLSWQTVDGNAATVVDLVESPVLFLSGRDQLDLTDLQKQALKEYIENGNFIFAEAGQENGCGNQVPFDTKFRQLIKELFPDSNLEPLSPGHPIWNSHFSIQPQADWPVFGIQACCRTSVVYCPRSLSCHWQLNRPSLIEELPREVRTEVRYATELGVNVMAYATGRQLRDKLDIPQLNTQAVSVLANRALVLPKLDHRGGSDDAPNAWRNVLHRAAEIGLTIDTEKKLIAATSEQLADYPFVFIHGRYSFFFRDAEVAALSEYLKGGYRGFIFADSICSSGAFDEAFRKQINQLVPGAALKPIPPTHPIWSDQYGGFKIKTVTITKPDRSRPTGFVQRAVPPQFFGIEIDGRLVVVYSPWDLSCALENATPSHCEGYLRDDAIKLAINVLLYRLQSD